MLAQTQASLHAATAHPDISKGPENRYAFDQQCRVKAIEMASRLFPTNSNTKLSINFMPNSVYEPRACIRLTLSTAERVGFPLDRIIFEFTENEQLDTIHVLNILNTYREIGFKTAIDDFGAGHAGVGLLTKFQPDIVKLDMELVRDIDKDAIKRTVVKHTLALLNDLGIIPLCEGIENAGKLRPLRIWVFILFKDISSLGRDLSNCHFPPALKPRASPHSRAFVFRALSN